MAGSTSASEYRAEPKKHEVEEKLRHAEESGRRPNTMVEVYGPDDLRIHAYSKAGIGAYCLTGPESGCAYHGSAPLDLGPNLDPAGAIAKEEGGISRLFRSAR